jgi:exodeoxyribonuclease-3
VRIATWNVNSLKARLDKVVWWLERARPDVLLMQETKLADADAPTEAFRQAGYELAHHGEGRWNGVAIASRCGITDVVTNFGQPLRPAQTPEVGDDEPFAEARMIAAGCGGIRVVSVYAPNGRSVGSPFYQAKLAWFDRLARWFAEAADATDAVVLGGDLERRARRHRRVGPAGLPRRHARCHRLNDSVSAGSTAWGLVDAYRLHHPSRPLHVVGLPRRQLPQELRHAHRSLAGDAPGRRAHGVGGDRP